LNEITVIISAKVNVVHKQQRLLLLSLPFPLPRSGSSFSLPFPCFIL